MIEFRDVDIRVGSTDLVAGLRASAPSGRVTVVKSGTRVARSSLVAAIAGILPHGGEILVDGSAVRPEQSLYVSFAGAAVVPHLDGYANIRMLTGLPARRSTIDALAKPFLDRGELERPAGELDAGSRHRLHLVAGIVSGARNLVFDGLVDEVGMACLEHLPAIARRTGAAILITAANPAFVVGKVCE